ncbi:21553_t:CDS:2, partial [Racocetra persica]
KGLKNKAFWDAAITASTLWKNSLHSEQECKELISQFRYYEAKKKPFDLPYVQDLDTSMLCNTNDNNGKSSGSMDFNPENLVDA